VSQIAQALEKLNGALHHLETSVGNWETTQKQNLGGQQPDMFGHPAPSNENAQIDAALVAERLDIAIERVEQVLLEAASA